MHGKITFCVAAARSGKSTFAKAWLAEENNDDRVIVNCDLIRLGVHGRRFDKRFEGLVHYTKENIIRHHLAEGMHVLVDETNTYEWTIAQLLRLDPEATPVYIKSTRGQCVERAIKDNQLDLVEKGVIERHFSNLEKLTLEYCGTKELNQENIEKVVQEIKKKRLI